MTGLVKLTALEWYSGANGYMEPNCPSLAVVYDNGRAQLMRHELDDSESALSFSLSPHTHTHTHTHACTKCTHNNFKNVHVFICSAPILLDTSMSAVTTVQWNPTGSIIAFGGTQRFQDGKELCAVQFYNAFGVVILIE